MKEKKKIKCYIAGPIRGVPDYKSKFEAAKKWIEAKGWVVLDPSTLPEGMTQADYMRICIAMIQSADTMCLLKGWKNSEGARIEEAYAEMIKIPAFEAGDAYEE